MTTFITLTLVYIPYIILSYPATIMGDCYAQMLQAYPNLGIITPAYLTDHLLSDSVYLSQHHPIAHTLLIHIFLQIGNTLFHSFNVGIFLFALLQFFFLLSSISYAVKILVNEIHLPTPYIYIIISYYIISPRIQSYMFLITKDVIYSVFLVYFVCFLYFLIKKPFQKHYEILFTLSSLGMILFRNESRYILLISLPIIIFLNCKLRKTFIKTSIILLGFCVIFFHLLLPLLNINPGSRREMLSVPFQQTARYVKEHSSEVTVEEQEKISNILDYSHLAENYFPDRSDAIKDTFNENSSTKDLLNYFYVWFQMFLKHPSSYINATINNYYYYFYPGPRLFDDFTYEGSALCMSIMNEAIKPLGTNFYYPSQLNHFRELYSTLREKMATLPFLSCLMIPATYTWCLIILLSYSFYRGNMQSLTIIIVPIVLVLMCLLGPCNGFYCRYLYPILVVLPIIIALYFNT